MDWKIDESTPLQKEGWKKNLNIPEYILRKLSKFSQVNHKFWERLGNLIWFRPKPKELVDMLWLIAIKLCDFWIHIFPLYLGELFVLGGARSRDCYKVLSKLS